jgi:hypothetical protein
MSTSRQQRSSPNGAVHEPPDPNNATPVAPEQTVVPISAAVAAQIANRQREAALANRELQTYLQGICDGMDRPVALLAGMRLGDDGVPTALIFNPPPLEEG